MQVFIIFVNSYADAALGYIASRPRSFWYFFLIMKFCCATASLPFATSIILKWHYLLLAINKGAWRQLIIRSRAHSSTSIKLKGHHIVHAAVTGSGCSILILLPTACP